MVAFTILSLIFYSSMRQRVYHLQCERLYSVSYALRNEIQDVLEGGGNQNVQLAEKVNLVADASRCVVWLVRQDGVLLHASELPESAAKQFQSLAGGLYQIPKEYIGIQELRSDGLVLQHSIYSKLFERKNTEWITALQPIYGDQSEVVAVLQLHLPFVDEYGWHWFLTNGVGVALLVALVIAIGLTLFLMQYLTRPLEALAKAAHRVSLGDYTVRLDLGESGEACEIRSLPEQDDLTKLMIAFNEMVAKLEVVNAERRDMISCLSHDMKTPLTSIIGFSEGILDGTVPESNRERYLNIIRQEALRLKNLLSDINEEQMLENRGTQNFTDFDLSVVLKETAASLENQILEKQLQVEFALSPCSWVTGDEEQIRRVVYNLVSNSVKFCRPADRIRMGVQKESKAPYIRCFVEDSGPGIPEEARAKIFGRFYKLDKSRGNREGSGLGLYICRKILANHGQQIFVTKSPELQGARFVFTLPLANPKTTDKLEVTERLEREKSTKTRRLWSKDEGNQQ